MKIPRPAAQSTWLPTLLPIVALLKSFHAWPPRMRLPPRATRAAAATTSSEVIDLPIKDSSCFIGHTYRSDHIAIGWGLCEMRARLPGYVSDIQVDAGQAVARATHVSMCNAMTREKCCQV